NTTVNTRTFVFQSLPNTLMTLQFSSDLTDMGPAVILQNDQGVPLGISRIGLLGGSCVLPSGNNLPYRVTVIHSGAERSESYTLTLVSADQTFTAPATHSNELVLPSGSACSLTTLEPQSVNIRLGPGMDYGRVASLLPNQIVPVIGRDAASTWWQVDYQGQIG